MISPKLRQLLVFDRAQFQDPFELLGENMRHGRAESSWLMPSSVPLSHGSSSLLIAHVTPLRNSRLKTEMDLARGHFVLIYPKPYIIISRLIIIL